MNTLSGNVLTPDGWYAGSVHFTDRISAIEGSPGTTAGEADCYILPGFIDLHVHGGGGRDVMEGGDALQTIARQHARHGTTSLLATTMTAPRSDIELALEGIGQVMTTRPSGTSRVLGVHLEGPFINPGKLGAQPNFARDGMLEEIEAFNAIAPIRTLTMAPEIKGHQDLIRYLAHRGIRIQLGHTLGSYEDGVAAMKLGATSFTHLFNAMTGLHHREPGITGAALAHAEFAELIPDLLHVHPGAIHTALRAIPKLYCVTDSTAAAGMPDGQYKLGSHTVTKCLGGVRLPDGTLAGSTLTMDEALRNLVSIGLEIDDASRRLSTYAADYLGLAERGRLCAGAWADMVVLDRNLRIKEVWIEGERLEHIDAP
ncbi:N-acetylglucosamine-6-phosphate deacetylase [Burkholderiaceae bacterium DAT-1]|nr:N-acetylglucosamine-6-phosphate deacetylase [Burkholderiaceae bacterium DAT-1]